MAGPLDGVLGILGGAPQQPGQVPASDPVWQIPAGVQRQRDAERLALLQGEAQGAKDPAAQAALGREMSRTRQAIGQQPLDGALSILNGASAAPPAPAQSTQPQPAQQTAPSWSDIPAQALHNALPSAGNFLSGIGHAIAHPIDTANNVMDTVEGGIRHLLPDNGARYDQFSHMNPNVPNQPSLEQQAALRNKQLAQANATGQFFANRYGSVNGLKNTLATDPVGALADASSVLTGGAALAGKVPALAGAARVVGAAGDAVNPVGIAAKVATKAAPAVGNGIAAAIGNLGTHTGAESIKQAFNAGVQGGDAAKALTDNMRGKVPMTDVLDTAKANLAEMARQRGEQYRAGMAQVSGDKSVLDFGSIDKALSENKGMGMYHDQVTNPAAAQTYQAITEAVNNWKSQAPAVYHTPEGFDALKRQIGGILEDIPPNQATAQKVGKSLYNAVKDTITDQAPVYADTMKGYSDATDQITEIQRALSLGDKASADTAMRKLQSLTRNNVNTNYGNRLSLAQQLEQQGGKPIMPALAGQTLNTLTPRGLGGAVAGGLGYGAYHFGGGPEAAATLLVQSPRLMGEAALASGRAAGAAKKAAQVPLKALGTTPISPLDLSNLLYQSGRLDSLPK